MRELLPGTISPLIELISYDTKGANGLQWGGDENFVKSMKYVESVQICENTVKY